MTMLADTDLLNAKFIKGSDDASGTFVLEPLSPGYGLTLGHALRRVLLSSLSGAAISSVKIDGATHEFSTVKGIKEDVVEIVLNLKSLRIRLEGDEDATIKLDKKGPGIVKAKDFEKNAQITIVDPEHIIATLDKNARLVLEANVKKGSGYEPVEKRKEEKLPLGTIAIDSIFTPVKKINYDVENTRVGGMTNYNRLSLSITTDGSITPQEAFNTALKILVEHFTLIESKLSNKKPAKAEKAPKEIDKQEDVVDLEKPVKIKKSKVVVEEPVKKATKKAKK